MKKVFVSYKHNDVQSFNDIKSLNKNPNNNVRFIDWSLSEPVCNQFGHVNRRPPFDLRSNSVNNKIIELLDEADKMLVLIGRDTHSSEWVNWEVNKFRERKNDNCIFLMRISSDAESSPPQACLGLELHDWNLGKFISFLENRK